MVSAPATNWMSCHARPASASAARAATMPYSVKSRPHLPHGCMPTPRTTRSRSLLDCAPCRRPDVDRALLRAPSSAVQRVDLELHRHPDLQVGGQHALGDLAEHDRGLRPRARPRPAHTARTGRRPRTAAAGRTGSRCSSSTRPRRDSGVGVELGAVAGGVGASSDGAGTRRCRTRALAPIRCGLVVGGEPPSTAGTRVDGF